MLTYPYFYILSLLSYSIYNILSYKFLAEKQTEIILKEGQELRNKFLLDDEDLYTLYINRLNNWRVGFLFHNERVFKFAIIGIPYILFMIYDKLGVIYIPIILVITFTLQVLVGLLFKGRGIQISTFLSFLMIILLYLKNS